MSSTHQLVITESALLLYDEKSISALLRSACRSPLKSISDRSVFKGTSFSLAPTNAPAGETTLLLPQFATSGGWSTALVIANATGIAQYVRVDFYDPAGVIIATLPNVNIPPAGVTVINR